MRCFRLQSVSNQDSARSGFSSYAAGVVILVCASWLLVGCGEDKPKPTPAPEACTPGTLACECDDDGACGDGLTCQAGTCVEAEPDECTPGEIGCACEGGQCGEGAVCNAQDLCEAAEPDCEDGSEGCACIAPDNTCDGSLTCVEGRCIATVEMGLGVGPDVRACDILLESDPAIISVVFADAVVGRSRASGAKMAISFTAKDDAALTDAPLQFGFASADAPDEGGVSILRADCFDSTGNKLQDSSLTLSP